MKLSKREQALIQHAARKAVEKFKRENYIRVIYNNTMLFKQFSLEALENMNKIQGIPDFDIYLDNHWRKHDRL